MPESAKEKLKKLLAWEDEPALTDAEIDELLAACVVADAEGNGPASEGWSPTYDVNSAAAEGWMIKAARAASTTETDPDSLGVTSRVFENCIRMAKLFSGKRAGSVRVTSEQSSSTA
jgi:hypothetical protein